MKETGTTIFTLALAMILVSSLSSGVIYANDSKGRDVEVVILDCGVAEGGPMGFLVTALHDNTDVDFGIVVATTECVDAIAAILKARFKMESSGSSLHPMFWEFFPNADAMYTRYTFVRNRRGPRDDD